MQPRALEEVVPAKRSNHRIPQKEKEEAVAAVKSGLTPHHVAQRIGVYHTTVSRWAKECQASGRVRPAGKLDPYAERIMAMIQADSSRSTNSLHHEFMQRERMKVAYTRFSKFIRELGFAGIRKPTACSRREPRLARGRVRHQVRLVLAFAPCRKPAAGVAGRHLGPERFELRLEKIVSDDQCLRGLARITAACCDGQVGGGLQLASRRRCGIGCCGHEAIVLSLFA